MDTIMRILFCLTKNIITKSPFAFILIAVVLGIYYKFSRLLLKKLLGEKSVKAMSNTTASNPAEFGHGLRVIFGHVVELLVLLIILIVLLSKVGLIQDPRETIRFCIGPK